MLDCSHPEDNTRKILQVLSSLQSRAEEIYFCTNDIYVVVLLSAYMPIFSKLTLLHRLQPNVELVWFETLLLVNQYNRWLCQVRKYTELLFLHSLSRCDYTSSFFHLGKVKFWDTCLVNASILNTFKCCDCLNLPLSKDDMNVIEKLVIFLYNVNSIENNSINIAQHELFKYCGSMEICSLPPNPRYIGAPY